MVEEAHQSLETLNEFLAYSDVSPVRHKLTIPWDDAHERTKRRYTSKATIDRTTQAEWSKKDT